MWPDIIVIAAIVLIIGAASLYIIKAKKSGKKCIGCPDSSSCGKCCGSCSSCHHCSSSEPKDDEK